MTIKQYIINLIISSAITTIVILFISGNVQVSDKPDGEAHNWDKPTHFWSEQ